VVGAASEPPTGRAAGIYGLQCGRAVRAKPIHEPRRRTSGRCVELGGERPTRLIHLGRPAFRRPERGHGGDRWWIGDLPGLAFYDEIELFRRDAQRAAWVTVKILGLAIPLARLEPESAIDK